ncbi:ATP-binding cassette domain-containing protein [candidate division KSB1 bacterium]|nr:ATP-binding cassette domain-containing protein [candidate division KSB1 bacterium]
MSTLRIEHVYKSFDDISAVHDLNLELHAGTIFGLLGPNGAGKTTTIRMIMNIIIPDQGNIVFTDKFDNQANRDQIGYLPEERGLYKKMKIRNLLTFLAEIKGVKPSASKARIDYWLKRFDLIDWIDKKIEELSRGMQQKVQFIATILHEPRLIILDEPFTGLDPVNTDLIKSVILECKQRGDTIIFSTHLMDQVEKLCDSICLINQGKAVLKGNLKDIKKNFRKNNLAVQFDGAEPDLNDIKYIKSYKKVHDHFEITPSEQANIQDILKQLIERTSINRFEIVEPSLHDIFVETVTHIKKGDNDRE